MRVPPQRSYMAFVSLWGTQGTGAGGHFEPTTEQLEQLDKTLRSAALSPPLFAFRNNATPNVGPCYTDTVRPWFWHVF